MSDVTTSTANLPHTNTRLHYRVRRPRPASLARPGPTAPDPGPTRPVLRRTTSGPAGTRARPTSPAVRRWAPRVGWGRPGRGLRGVAPPRRRICSHLARPNNLWRWKFEFTSVSEDNLHGLECSVGTKVKIKMKLIYRNIPNVSFQRNYFVKF